MKKQFAVKLWLEIGATFGATVIANNKADALIKALELAKNKYGENSACLSNKIKEIPTCTIRSAFGCIPVKVEPNYHYNDEIIINGTRVALPYEFNYWDINSIVIHNAGLPVIATITTDKGKFVVQNNVNGCGKRFEIIK